MADASIALAPDPGRRWPWVRDLSLVGGATGVGAPLAVMVLMHSLKDEGFGVYLAAAGLAGLLTGALLGAATPSLVQWKLGRVPRIGFILAGLGLGAAWGAAVGALAGLALEAVEPHWRGIWALSMVLGTPVGALQLGWFWLLITGRRLRRRSTAAIVAAASILAPALGVAAWVGVMTHH